MAVSKKLAIFDFDGTIYKYQSPDQYADFVAKKSIRNQLLQLVCQVLARSRKYNGIHHKKAKLLKIKGTSAEQLEQMAHQFLDKVILDELIEQVDVALDRYTKDPEFDVVVVSAGYDIYLKHFCKLRNISLFAATDIEVLNGVATGRIKGVDCYGTDKIDKIKAILDLNRYDLANSVCYSDSKSDMPIFNLVGNKYFVYLEGSEYKIKNI